MSQNELAMPLKPRQTRLYNVIYNSSAFIGYYLRKNRIWTHFGYKPWGFLCDDCFMLGPMSKNKVAVLLEYT